MDVNGDGLKDTNDQIGYGIITGNIIDHLYYDAGAEMTTRDTDGKPLLKRQQRTQCQRYGVDSPLLL